ncbi:hypothetical protein QDT13_000706 [Acinetobacter baumannii]|uniref:hypothetical protein n=1 Tax=Acinetobacter baumannii TaxID=470 RepID=UPI00065F4969|nr:hypothetical protein [Acinetobacter baumannii]AKQ29899.1 hypothetical protein ACX61_05675 [Acinetobacter baumannii]EKV3804885.1 hypothetical protein [Acinetobacter baumannii]EKW1171342.1 hypothetical protein [Acinetobacter baumannii]MCG9258277.1 hypothetical protein [Acinetobacter baumannii]MCG9261938.1 hypothetical protein [Acinetobacter baumannii]
MDNYKIKVKDEAESKEAQELFVKLGFEKTGFSCDEFPCYLATWEGGFSDYVLDSLSVGRERKELTLPQLRDLVVLKRNDSRDANVNQDGEIPCLYDLYLTADKELYFYHCGKGKWLLSNLNHDEDYYATLKPIEKSHPQDPALISGAEALRALADEKEVEYLEVSGKWRDAKFLTANVLLVGDFSIRLKPQTIKVELEIPAPYKAKIGGRDDTSFVLNVGRHQYCYKNEEDYTKARDALEAVFDAAVRGTNS